LKSEECEGGSTYVQVNMALIVQRLLISVS